MVITIFRSRLRPEHQGEYTEWASRMHDLAVKMPGFISIKTFGAEDGERVSLVEFESEECMQTWRKQSDHLQAQDLGRKLFLFRIPNPGLPANPRLFFSEKDWRAGDFGLT